MPSTKKPLTPAADPASELRPDGWERFEKAVDVALMLGQHRMKPSTDDLALGVFADREPVPSSIRVVMAANSEALSQITTKSLC